MRRDLSHLLLVDRPDMACSAPSHEEHEWPAAGERSSDAGWSASPPPDLPEAGRGYYWNLFAHPVTVGDRPYAFLTDVRSVLGISESVFQELQQAQGGPVPDSVPRDQCERLAELGIVRRDAAPRQFDAVFGQKVHGAKEHKLLHIITSYTCNLTCSYCFMLANLGEHGRKLLSFEDAKKGIDLFFRVPHAADSVIHFYGGEPLLHPQLIHDCMTYITERYSTKVIPKIITNGTLYGPQVMHLLGRYPFDLSVSMDGDQQAHDVFRLDHGGRSTFAKTVAGLRVFRDIGYEPKVLITVGQHNIRRLPEIVSFVLSLQPHAIALNFPRELPAVDTGLDGEAGEAAFWIEQYERCLELCYAEHIPELYFADILFAYFSGEPVLSPCAACGSQVSPDLSLAPTFASGFPTPVRS